MHAITRLHTLVFAVVILALGAGALLRLEPGRAAIKTDWLRGATAQSFEHHYNEVFPAKTLGTNVWAAIEYSLFKEGRRSVVVGRDGWLFSAEEFETHPAAEQRIAAHAALIHWVADELARRGIALLVAPVPAKARLQPDQIDPAMREPATIQARLYPELLRILSERQIPFADLAIALQRCRERSPQPPIYLRTDTHWTPQGADCAARALAVVARSRALPAAMGSGSYQTVIENPAAVHEGDLLRFLPLAPYFAHLQPPAESLEAQHTERLDDSGSLLGEMAAPEIALVGTSYSANRQFNFVGALQQAFGGDVLSHAVDGKGPFVPMLQYLQDAEARQLPPKLVIWEIPERYLHVPFDFTDLGLPEHVFAALPNTASAKKPAQP